MKGGRVIEYFWNSISKLPIRRINFSNIKEKSAHDQIVKHVNKLLEAKAQAKIATTSTQKDHWARQCETFDWKIETLVIELYGLTEEEVARIKPGYATAEQASED
jgi:hypothetical protein